MKFVIWFFFCKKINELTHGLVRIRLTHGLLSSRVDSSGGLVSSRVDSSGGHFFFFLVFLDIFIKQTFGYEIISLSAKANNFTFKSFAIFHPQDGALVFAQIGYDVIFIILHAEKKNKSQVLLLSDCAKCILLWIWNFLLLHSNIY